MRIIFEIQQHDDCWSFRTVEHGLHMGFPDALQATAAAMRAFDEKIPRIDTLISDLKDVLDDVSCILKDAKTKTTGLRLVSNND